MERLGTAPTSAPPPALARQRNALLAILIGLAIAGWVIFIHQARQPMAMNAHRSMGPDLTMGRSWPLFLGMWVAMMAGMMFPAAAPMVLMYARMRRRDPLSVTLFTSSYLALWFAFGALAYLLGAAAEAGASRSDWIATNWGRAGGLLLVLAGFYQLTPLKDVCLRHCRTPLSFVMTHWHDGRDGAVRMGLTHGLYCFGCCWLLFVILVPLGMMNLAATLAIAALVLIEKVAPWGRAVGRVAAVGLLLYGVSIMLQPVLLPTVA